MRKSEMIIAILSSGFILAKNFKLDYWKYLV